MSGRRLPGRPLRRRLLAAATLVLTLAGLGAASPALAADEALPDLDRRTASLDPAEAGRTDRLLTGPSSRSPREIVLDYVRAHDDVFALAPSDVANLELVARSVSPDGIVHLRFNQVLDGILSFDSGIDGHVTADGRLVTVSGSPVPGARLAETDPALGPRAGLREARQAVDGAAGLPAATAVAPTPERSTSFAGGERAVLRWSPGADGPRLVWSVIADGDASTYEVLIDAESGEFVRRQDLASHLGKARYFPADPLQTPTPVEITMPPEWYDQNAGGTRLWGQYSRTYVDRHSADPEPGEEDGAELVQIPASNGDPAEPDWLYAQTLFPAATPCPPSGCTWNNAVLGSEDVNQFQAGTNAHVLSSRFHDHLEAAPIGFDEASGNFQRTNPSGSGLGGDYVRLEVNDGEGTNNANFLTPPDGIPPRMQMFLYTRRDVNGSDIADIVYHEYAHGLSNRLVVTASGASALGTFQSKMMGEGWSDFYAVDLLVAEGHMNETAAPGELRKGFYIYSPNGTRNKPIDCPVDAGGKTAACNGGTDVPVLGGYTYGDIVSMYTKRIGPGVGWYNESPHEGGEIWGETLWDIRRAVGRNAALALITGGMRLSVDYPSMLDMRDAILQQAVATRSAPGAADDYVEELWEVFAARGMGADARSATGDTTFVAEGFGLLDAAAAPTLTDPYPEGDNDGVIEPGEGIRVSQPLRTVAPGAVSGIKGTLSAGGGATVLDASADWPTLAPGQALANADPLAARLPAGCINPVPLTLTLSSPRGPASVRHTVDLRPGSTAAPLPLADASGATPGVTTSTIQVAGSGNVTDLGLRIDELRHPRLGDLKFELIHDGVTATVLERSWLGQDIRDLVLHRTGASWFALFRRGPMSGLYKPVIQGDDLASALSVFNGHPVAGTWTLRITDQQEGEAGVLHRWGIDAPQQDCGGRLEIPAAQTGSATAIQQGAATLNGAVTPNGRATGARFAFGTTTAYGKTTGVVAVGDGDAPVDVSEALSGLQPGTNYHYRLETIREGGEVAVVGPDRTFTTAAVPGVDPPGPAVDPPGPPPAVDSAAPVISGATVTLGAANKRTGRRRTSFSLALSEPARVSAALTRAAPGIRNGKRCLAPPRRHPRGAKACVRQLPAARASASLGTAGRGTLRLPGAGLAKGSYVATLTATDAAGNASPPVLVRFRVR